MSWSTVLFPWQIILLLSGWLVLALAVVLLPFVLKGFTQQAKRSESTEPVPTDAHDLPTTHQAQQPANESKLTH